MIKLSDISITFNKTSNYPIEVLKNVSLTFLENEWTFIIGGNGSGKTTLLKIINQTYIPDEGEIVFTNISLNDILYIEQATFKNIVPSMTIYENLVFGLKNEGMLPNLDSYHKKVYKEKIINVLRVFELGLEKRLNEQIRFLSGGEQQIIVASRIMLSNPKVLLMDEFTSALDQKWAPFILRKLREFTRDNNIIVIAITHDYSQIDNIADRVILLKRKIIGKDITTKEHNFTRDYILSIFYEKE